MNLGKNIPKAISSGDGALGEDSHLVELVLLAEIEGLASDNYVLVVCHRWGKTKEISLCKEEEAKKGRDRVKK
jgi:hypothetical protein